MRTRPNGQRWLRVTAAALALLGPVIGIASAAPDPTAAATTGRQIVGVSGNTMILDGRPWLPRGVNISGLEATAPFFRANYPEEYTARLNYGPAERAAARAFGADTLRIQVSQPSLDPRSPLFSLSYVQDVLRGIADARRDGFIVVIMMQDEKISGEPDPQPLATAETMRDWMLLNDAFGHDRGVLFELYNEPELRTVDAADWALWKDGGAVPGFTTRAVGMQEMIDRLRAAGCETTFVLDGLDFAHSLAGVPDITDPLDRVVYAVHPYFDGEDREGTWDAAFGEVSGRLPVFADEWSAEAGGRIGLGQLPSFQESVDFLNYLRAHRIPLAGGAFDRPGFMVRDVPGWTPSDYDNYVPSQHLDDAGLLVHVLFETGYSRELTDADAVTH